MTAPAIDSVTPASALLTPGQFVDVTIIAHDPDNKSGNVEFPVVDGQGNTSIAAIALTVEDPLAFGTALNPDGLSVSVTGPTVGTDPATGHPNAVYRVTAV